MSRSFDGNGDYVSYTDGADFSVGTSFTLSMWAKVNSGRAGVPYLYSHDVYATNESISLYINLSGTSNRVRFDITETSSDFVEYTGTAATITSGTWAHICLVRDSTSGKLYINGSLIATGTDAGLTTSINPTSSIVVGDRSDNAAGYDYYGEIGEVGIWSRVLSLNEILSLAAGTTPGQLANSLMMYTPYWGKNSPELDNSGRAHTGTLTNTTAADHGPRAPEPGLAGG